MHFLLGVPGKIKTLSDRLSATWAGRLDVSVSSAVSAANTAATNAAAATTAANTAAANAAAATTAANTAAANAAAAAQSAVWTDTKAGHIDAPISSMFRIKSLQTVQIQLTAAQTSNTATISAVNTAKTILIPLGTTCSADYTMIGANFGKFSLTNSTTVTLDRSVAAATMTGRVQVVEFY